MPKTFEVFLVMADIKAGRLSLWIDHGDPNLEMISFKRVFETCRVVLVQVANASTYPENVSVSTSRYLKFPPAFGITVKSTSQSSPRCMSRYWVGWTCFPGAPVGWVLGLFK